MASNMRILGLTGMPAAGKGTALERVSEIANEENDVFFMYQSCGDLIRSARDGMYGDTLRRELNQFYKESGEGKNAPTYLLEPLFEMALDSARKANYSVFIWDGVPRRVDQLKMIEHGFGIEVPEHIALQRNRQRTLQEIIQAQNGHFGNFPDAQSLCDAYLAQDPRAFDILQLSIGEKKVRKDAPKMDQRIRSYVTDTEPTIGQLKLQNRYTVINGHQPAWGVAVDLHRALQQFR